MPNLLSISWIITLTFFNSVSVSSCLSSSCRTYQYQRIYKRNEKRNLLLLPEIRVTAAPLAIFHYHFIEQCYDCHHFDTSLHPGIAACDQFFPHLLQGQSSILLTKRPLSTNLFSTKDAMTGWMRYQRGVLMSMNALFLIGISSKSECARDVLLSKSITQLAPVLLPLCTRFQWL